jgi:signal transduction histidine kinase
MPERVPFRKAEMNRNPSSKRRRIGRGAGMPRLARLRTGGWLALLLLLLSLGIAAAAILQAQRAVRSHRTAAEGLLRDYAAFTAWSYRQHAEERLNAAFTRAFAPVREAYYDGIRAPLPPAQALFDYGQADTLRCSCAPNYGASYYFRIPLAGEAPEFAGAAPPQAIQPRLADMIRAHAGTEYEDDWSGMVLTLRAAGEVRHVVYAIWDCPGGDRSAYGFELDAERYRPLFDRILEESPLLPAGLMDGRKNAQLVAIQVGSPDDPTFYASAGDADWRLAAEDTLGRQFGGLIVRATVRPEVANSLVIGGLPRSRLPLLIGLLVLAISMSVLAAEQLRRQGELARLRSDFVSSASHELRTPLAQVRLFLETLRLGRYSTDGEREWIMESMERETTRLTALVDNVLHFSRAERGATGGDLETIELAPYLRQVAESFAPLAASRRVRFDMQFEPGLLARLHPESFRQVILNLLENAVKYGPRGGTVRIGSDLAGERVRIMVDDEGPGVESQEREQIWKPFRRGRGAIGSVAVGSGIGLSVVREIVEWHGGSCWIEDAEAGGARFVLEIPGWREPEMAEETAAEVLQEAI